MRIKKIQIKNFKSLVDFELEDLKPFCAFVGPNASGKSNIFEALEFLNVTCTSFHSAPLMFGGKSQILSFRKKALTSKNGFLDYIYFHCQFEDGFDFPAVCLFDLKDETNEGLGNIDSFNVIDDKIVSKNRIELDPLNVKDPRSRLAFKTEVQKLNLRYDNDYEQFIDNFSRIFVGKSQLKRTNQIQTKLAPDASNLSQVIGRIFEDDNNKSDFIEWLQIIIPEFKDIEIKQSNIDGSFEFFIYEKSSNKPFPKHLISDGTYNILALMAAVYQTDQPQFLCIEEPENGLHPQAIQLLVDFFREKCEKYGHHIWLNTHSQTLVRCMEIDELILVNKVDGETRAKQLTKEDEVNLKTDEAWLSNALGGGILWSK